MGCWSDNEVQCPHGKKHEQTIFEAFQRGAAELGFEYCAMLMLCTDTSSATPLVANSSFPEQWSQHLRQHYDYQENPVIKHCQASVLPALWSQALFSSLPRLWEDLCLYDLKHGFSQSVHDPRGLTSIFCFARHKTAICPRTFYEQVARMLWLTNRTHALLAEKVVAAPPQVRLTPREIEVLKWTAEGKTAGEIAIILSLTERTISFHVTSIMHKLGVRNKMAAVVQAVKKGLI